MNCIVTAGPTYESLDQVRRLTNFSTGRLGTELANYLVARGHQVRLLLGHYATHHGQSDAQSIQPFTTTDDLRERFKKLSGKNVDAIFHAAAVSDFKFGKFWERRADGTLIECRAGKLSTRSGTLLAELVPTAKVIAGLRDWFPETVIVGWKYEVDGKRDEVLEKARKQVSENRSDASVANGPAYGRGFALVKSSGDEKHCANAKMLFRELEDFAVSARRSPRGQS
jgi:phosphopantothenoylcysteine decarboxylase/phosphopantothenate--cysteine ligase